ncbi:MAG: XdhC family protein [Sphingomonadales bacterium]|nr:XdhC family protein [Sphingomonadales bacterium]
MRRAVLDRLAKAHEAGQSVVLATNLESGEQAILEAGEPGEFCSEDLTEAVAAAARADRSQTVTTDAGEIFLQVFNPPLRLAIVGAVHIAQALAPMAAGLGYQVKVIDPRGAFGSVERFPDVALVEDWPDDVLDREPPDARTAVVTLTHDPKLDDAALQKALASPAFYIGSLGSKRTHAARLERLGSMGFGAADLARIHGPIGLAIGSRTAPEIAVAILAQMTQTLRQGAGG